MAISAVAAAASPSLGCCVTNTVVLPPLAFCSAAAMRHGPSIRPCPTSLPTERPSPPTYRLSARWHGRKEEPDGDPIATLVEGVASMASTPVVLFTGDPPLALGYPIVLLAGIWILPFVTAILLVISFGLYAWLGRSVVVVVRSDWDEEEEDEFPPPVDLLALGAAIVTSGLLTPLDSPVNNGATTIPIFSNGTILISMVMVTLLALIFAKSKVDDRIEFPAETTSPVVVVDDEDLLLLGDATKKERDLMGIWDQSLNSSQIDKTWNLIHDDDND